jgi:hypothetical protein
MANCSYCGKNVNDEPALNIEGVPNYYVDGPKDGRILCRDCLVSVFDTVLSMAPKIDLPVKDKQTEQTGYAIFEIKNGKKEPVIINKDHMEYSNVRFDDWPDYEYIPVFKTEDIARGYATTWNVNGVINKVDIRKVEKSVDHGDYYMSGYCVEDDDSCFWSFPGRVSECAFFTTERDAITIIQSMGMESDKILKVIMKKDSEDIPIKKEEVKKKATVKKLRGKK